MSPTAGGVPAKASNTSWVMWEICRTSSDLKLLDDGVQHQDDRDHLTLRTNSKFDGATGLPRVRPEVWPKESCDVLLWRHGEMGHAQDREPRHSQDFWALKGSTLLDAQDPF